MTLTFDQVVGIEQLAANLKKWADNLSYSPPSPTIITILPYSEHKKVILWLLSEMPAVGQRVEKDFNELYKTHLKVDSWRGKAITEDNEEEFTILVDSLKGALYDLEETLQQIADRARKELSSEKPAETGGKVILSKIWMCIKRIPRWLYLLVGFLAALLTCIYFSWWLWTTFWRK